MEGFKVGTKQWAGGCLDTDNGGIVGTEGEAGSGNLIKESGVLGSDTWVKGK